jgi:hypothetical protein
MLIKWKLNVYIDIYLAEENYKTQTYAGVSRLSIRALWEVGIVQKVWLNSTKLPNSLQGY